MCQIPNNTIYKYIINLNLTRISFTKHLCVVIKFFGTYSLRFEKLSSVKKITVKSCRLNMIFDLTTTERYFWKKWK